MRYEPGHKARTRAKILLAAGRLFRREGYHATGVDEVMEEAGLTAGGFYSHFKSKEELLAEMLMPAAAGVDLVQDLEGLKEQAKVQAFVDSYLRQAHLNNTEDGCPLPALVSEVARTGAPVKASFEAIVRGLAARLRGAEAEGINVGEDRVLAIIALCVGGLGLARSVTDPAFKERILAACRDFAKVGLECEAATPINPTPKRKIRSSPNRRTSRSRNESP